MSLMLPDIDEDGTQDVFGKSKNESIPEGVFTRLRSRRQIYGVPTATAKRVMKSINNTSIINNNVFFYPNKGLLKFKYAIDYNLDSNVSEWHNEDGIVLDNIANQTLLKADGGTFPAMFIITSQQDILHDVNLPSQTGGNDGTLITDANYEMDAVDLEEYPYTNTRIFFGFLTSIMTANIIWMKARIQIYAGGGLSELKIETSEDNITWVTHQTTSSNGSFTISKKLENITFRYFRVLLTTPVNSQNMYFNMVAWKD